MEVYRFVAFCCQIILSSSLENLSLKKSASQSSNLHNNKWLAGAAVDGNGNQALSGNSCACTGHYKPTVWWKVNLGDVYSISKVNIFYRNDGSFTHRLSGFKLYVTLQDNFIDSSPVYVNNNGVQNLPFPPANFTVTVATYGQYVTLYKDKSGLCTSVVTNINYCALFELCEVEVLGCPKTKYGTDCQSVCNVNCLYDMCAVSDGKCYGCKAGYTGDKCNQLCVAGTYGSGCSKQCSGDCKDGASCDVRNGSCPAGCSDGYKGTFCNESCSAGRFGSSCSSNCGSCRNNKTCNYVNGSCPSGCGLGVSGKYCKTPCADGTYGFDCTKQCGGHCRDGVSCDVKTGSCPAGCSDGYKGTHCNESCSPGTFGSSCSSNCGSCKNNKTCNHVNGSCPNGCGLGVSGKYCDTPCKAGGSGPNCIDICGKCINGTTCDRQTGVCHQGCSDGYWGSVCKDKCQTGTYGPKCSLKCVKCNTTCHHATGKCPVSDRGESTDVKDLTLPFITYGVISSVIIFILIGVIIIMCFLRRKCSFSSGKKINKDDLEFSMSNKSGQKGGPVDQNDKVSVRIMKSDIDDSQETKAEKYEELGPFRCERKEYETLTKDEESIRSLNKGTKELRERKEMKDGDKNYEEIHTKPEENTYEPLRNSDNSKYANL